MILELVLQTLLIFRSSHTREDLVNEKCIVNFTQNKFTCRIVLLNLQSSLNKDAWKFSVSPLIIMKKKSIKTPLTHTTPPQKKKNLSIGFWHLKLALGLSFMLIVMLWCYNEYLSSEILGFSKKLIMPVKTKWFLFFPL